MKMSLLPLVLALIAFTSSTKAWAADDGTLSVPDVGQVKKIVLRGEGLILTIFQNGSADITYGVNGEKDARIPSRTFSFEHVYNILTPSLSSADQRYAGVGFPGSGTFYGPTYHFYSHKDKIIDQLLADAGVQVKRID